MDPVSGHHQVDALGRPHVDHPAATDKCLDVVAPHTGRVHHLLRTDIKLGANLSLDLAVADHQTVVVTYAAEPNDPALPVRACMTANVTLRFVLLYQVPRPYLVQAAQEITAAVADGALTELPAHKFSLDDIAAAHEAVEAGAVGKVLIDIP